MRVSCRRLLPATLMLVGLLWSLTTIRGAALARDGAPPPLLTRTDWGARPAQPGMQPHQPYGIVVHHTGAPQNRQRDLAQKLRRLQAFSQAARKMPGGRTLSPWPDLPYHYYIGVDGTVGEGRDVNYAGDTSTRYDPAGYVQVVLEGNFEVEQPTALQLSALKQVLSWQAARWGVPIAKISVHKDHARTVCPGKNLAAVLPQLLAELQRP